MDVKKFIELIKDEFGLVCENTSKLERAIYGTATGKGLVGGVGEEASAEEILAKYDLLAGLVTKDGFKVKTGTFFDKKANKIVKNPKIVLLVKINGEFVEQVDGEAESVLVKAAKSQKGKKGKDEDEE